MGGRVDRLLPLTGEKRALRLAVGVGENLLRQMDKPVFASGGEFSARETGWALRAFTALYLQTRDGKWLGKCEWIAEHFYSWNEKYGAWLSPYTDHTLVRIPFMIAVGVSSLMCLYRAQPSDRLKNLIINTVDDMIENCMINGLFYYKELPSLRYTMSVPCMLEALSAAYALSGDKKYIEAGLPTLNEILKSGGGRSFDKRIEGDAVICAGASPKAFAQTHLPVALFLKCMETSAE